MKITVELNEADLLARMRNFEDHIVERKVVKDEKDWKKTAVALQTQSQSAYLPCSTSVFGTPAKSKRHSKTWTRSRRSSIDTWKRSTPGSPMSRRSSLTMDAQALAVVIPGSESRPHFAGLSYVRRGSESIESSEEQFSELISQRNSKTALLLQSKGKNVTVFIRTGDSEIPWPTSTVLVECNQFYVTLKKFDHEPAHSFPLSRVEISFDNLRNTLQLEISDPNRNAWNVQLERQVHQIVGFEMTHEGQIVLKHLLSVGKAEFGRQLA